MNDEWKEKRLKLPLLEDEYIVTMFEYRGYLYIGTNLRRVWKSTDSIMPFFDLVEITEELF